MTLLTSNPSTPSVRTKAYSCGCNTQLAPTEGKVTVSSLGHTLPSKKLH